MGGTGVQTCPSRFCAEPHRPWPPETEQPPRPVTERRREPHLYRGPEERDAPDGGQFVEREVKTYGEEQQRHPDLGEQLDVVDLPHRGSPGVGAYDYAGHDVAQD